MAVPRRYSYDPPWWLIMWESAAGLAMVLVGALDWYPITFTVGIVVGATMALFALLLMFRRVACKRVLELTEDALFLPTGFLRLRMARIPYGAIIRVWESRWAFGTVLYVLANQRKYEILCGLMLEPEDYVSVRDFLIEQLQRTLKEG